MPTPSVVRKRRAVKAGIAAMAIALAGAIAIRWYLNRHVAPSSIRLSMESQAESEILSRVNAERTRAGRVPLKFSDRLAVVARGHSYDMAIRRYFAHSSPDGITPAQRATGAGIGYHAIAENLFFSADLRDDAVLASRAVEGWMNSPEHRAQMLAPDFLETGIGVARSGVGEIYVTQEFVR